MIVEMDDFNFYLKFAKPLVLNLPDARDRTIAALWVKKLRDMNSNGSEGNMRIEYLKLLLFVMQRNKLAGIFEKAPPEGLLLDFPSNFKAADMLFLVKPKRAVPLDYPPVFTSVGGDLCQFVAIQEIPNFGLHGYYAISTQPLSKWSHASTNAARKLNTITKQSKCFENTCQFVRPDFEEHKRCSPSQVPSPRPHSSGLKNQAPTDSKNEICSKNTKKLVDCEKLPTYTTPCVTLPSIPFQSFRTEIGGMESRPTWGRSRYIERLIDESPHLIADLESCQANAMLHGMSDKKFKKVDSSGNCLLSEKRKQVERMMDYPACAVDPGNMEQMKSDSSNTCVPKKDNTVEIPMDECLSDNFYPCGNRSGLSLRGGSDDGNCCQDQRNTTRYPVTSTRTKFPQAHFDDSDYLQSEPHRYKNKSGSCCGGGNNSNNQPSNIFVARKLDSTQHSKTGRQAKLFDSIFADTNHSTDVDNALQKTMTMRKFSNSDQFGNFKWLEDMENLGLADPTDTTFNDSDSRTIVRSHSSDLLANNFYQLEMDECSETSNRLQLDEQLQLEELMPQVSWQVRSSNAHHSHRSQPRSPSTSYFFDDGYHTQARSQKLASTQDCDDGISKMIVRRRMSKSREATPHNPEIHERICQWKEIIDQAPEYDQIYDPEYLEYMRAVRQDNENRYDAIHDDYDEQHDDIEPQSYSNYMLNQISDIDPTQYTRDLFHPPEVPRSEGKVNPPLSAKYRRMQAPEENRQRKSIKKKPGKSAEHINRT